MLFGTLTGTRTFINSSTLRVAVPAAAAPGAVDGWDALLKRFGLFGPPGILFFDAAGKERAGLRVVGFMKAEPFATVLDRAL